MAECQSGMAGANESICAELKPDAKRPSQGSADFIMEVILVNTAAHTEGRTGGPDQVGWLARAEQTFRAHEEECSARLADTEQDIERLRSSLEEAMGSLARAFHAQAAPGEAPGATAGSLEAARLEAAVMAIQFQDIGGQWLAHIAAHLRQTRALVEELRTPFDVVRLAALGDWHGFERGSGACEGMDRSLSDLRQRRTSHPVGRSPGGGGDVELF